MYCKLRECFQKHLRRNHWEQQHGKTNIDDLIKKIRLDLVNSGENLYQLIINNRLINALITFSVEETENDTTDGISVVIVGDENSLNQII